MLPKINRLTKNKDFEQVFKKGKSLESDFLIFKALKNNFGKTRIGFVVSKKVSSKAAVRNKIKRRLRSAVLNELKNRGIFADVVIIALHGAQNMGFLEIKDIVSKFFKKNKDKNQFN